MNSNKLNILPHFSILGALVLGLTGCVTADPIMSPGGKQGFAISCDGTARSMTDCYKKAAEVCPKGYNVVDKNSESGFSANAYYVGNTKSRDIFVECK